MQEESLVTWLKDVGTMGMPRWGWAVVTAILLLEAALGRSSNPQLRSIAAAVATLLRAALDLSRLSRVPGLGALLTRLLDAVAPPAEKGPIPSTEMPTPVDTKLPPPEPPKP